MAMSRRMSGSGQGPRRVPTMGSYDNFKPRSELKEEDGALLLLVYLPGYLQQQITYSKDESFRVIRLSGERALANNKRQRFNFSHKVPDDCNFNEIKSHFQSGTFTIRIPKITTAPKATTPQQEGTTKTAQDSSTRPQETNENQVRKPQDSAFQLKEQYHGQLGKPGEGTTQEGTLSSRKETITGVTTQDTRVKPQEEQRQEASRALEPKVGTTFEKGQDKDTQKASISGDRSTSSSKKGDHSTNVAGGKKGEVMGGKIKEIDEKSVEENRRLMVNAGAAVVVIMALGAHMFTHLIGCQKG